MDVLISKTTTGGFGEVLWRHLVVVTFLCLDSDCCKDIVNICFEKDGSYMLEQKDKGRKDKGTGATVGKTLQFCDRKKGYNR